MSLVSLLSRDLLLLIDTDYVCINKSKSLSLWLPFCYSQDFVIVKKLNLKTCSFFKNLNTVLVKIMRKNLFTIINDNEKTQLSIVLQQYKKVNTKNKT